jgi:uncharacterized protein (DUF1800 family)
MGAGKRILIACVALLLWSGAVARAEIDLAIDKLVWKMVFGLTDAQVNDHAWLARDDDGDGLSNGAELRAGTNPLQASSTLAITAVSGSEQSALLTFATVRGKRYAIESTTTLEAPATWSPFAPAVELVGNGAAQTIAVPRAGDAFYRAVVQDMDTDGDGVSDWAEIITGYDPESTHSHGAAIDDHTALTAQLPNENIVSLLATQPSATQPPNAQTAATQVGAITVSRGGRLHFSTITVPLAASGTALEGIDYLGLPDFVTLPARVSSVSIPVIPLANLARLSNATVTLQALAAGGYTLGPQSSASVVIHPAGHTTGTGLTGYYYNSTAAAIGAGYNAALFDPANLRLTRNDATVDFVWNNVSPGPGVNATNYVVRWLGQVQPQYSQTYYFVTRTNDGVKLWVNGQLLVDKWVNQSATDWTGAIDLSAGVLYDIRMEYYQATGNGEAHLSWYSANQVKQIIPTARLYPAAGGTAPPSITSALSAVGFVNQPFTFAVVASNSATTPTTFTLGANSGPLPPGLTLHANTGVISGIPKAAGDRQVTIVASSTFGIGSSVLNIRILDTGNAITREVWTSGVTGPAISDIPVNSPPSSIDQELTALEDSSSYGDNTASRLRGYFTAPATANYYFWIAASNVAELWISNDGEPVNKVRRAIVTAPGTGAQTWDTQPNQKSAWLSLQEGQRYYFEVLHNHGVGTANDHVAVAWFQDPSGTTPDPVANNTGVVPGFVLSPYDYPVGATAAGTLYATNMAPQGGAITSASGSANLRLNADRTQAILRFRSSGLSTPQTSAHVHSDPFGTHPSQIIFDIDDIDRFHPELKTPDGGYIWNIEATGTLSAAEIVTAIEEGNAYINIHTVNYPAGEIRGNFALVFGSQTPPVPVPDPGYDPSSASTDAGAARFLNQATFGASPADVAFVKANGFPAWLDAQFALPASRLLPEVLANITPNPVNLYPGMLTFNAWWKQSVTAPDQLRQRVAFALSEILVVSDEGVLFNNGRATAAYYDTLLDAAFLNFRDILKQVTLTPAMGLYLDMRANQKGSLLTGLHPNENYAREIIQLFSLGLNRLWPDGTLVLDSQGNLIPTYDQAVIDGVSRVLTGWNYNQPLVGGRLPTNFNPAANFIDPMVLVPTRHELGTKLVLDNAVLPAARGFSIFAAPTPGSEADPANPAFDTYCLQDLEKALDSMFYNDSVGPFICRQLIQRLVTSNPSPGYLHRVVQKFNDDGSPQHVRGNMPAVIRAILLDGEARSTDLPAELANKSGKQREPLMRITGPARAFPSVGNTGTYTQNGGPAIAITTSAPHRLAANNGVFLDFTGNIPLPPDNPTTGAYSVLNNPAPTTFTFSVTATGLLNVTYTQPANSNTLTVNTGGPQRVGAKVYLDFITGGAPDGLYTIVSLPDSTRFTVNTTEDPATIPARSGNVLLPRLNAGYTVRNPGNPPNATISIGTQGNHNLQVNDHVWLDFPAAGGSTNPDGEYTITSIGDEDHLTIVLPGTTLTVETNSGLTVYPLVPPPVTRSGNVRFEQSKFDPGSSDSDLGQTPLNAPTVFNFFSPDYRYPGTLAANNITTPEFQLTTDTGVVALTNAIAGAILSSNNTNGLTSYRSGNNAITMDLSPYMTAAQTSNAAIPALVDKLADLLTGGQMTAEARAVIVNFTANTTNFPFSATPTNTQMRDRVRAVVHLIVTSPEYAIQK